MHSKCRQYNIGKLKANKTLLFSNSFCSVKPRKKFPKAGPNGQPIVMPSIPSQNFFFGSQIRP